MLRYTYYLFIALMTIGCSHKSSGRDDINYYRQHFDEAKQKVSECQEKLKDDKSYTENHQDCKDAFYVAVLDFSMESARREH